MHYLFILNDPPYGTERSYNGLRLATAGTPPCALAGQTTPRDITTWSGCSRS